MGVGKKISKKTNIFVKAMVFSFIVFCAVTIVSQQIQFNVIKDERAALEAEINDEKERIQQFNEELEQPMDDGYIMRIARSKLNYHLPEEIIFYNDLEK